MAMITCYIDDRALAVLKRLSMTKGRSVEQLAGDIIESEAISHLPGGQLGMHFHRSDRLDLGSTSLDMDERPDGSIAFRPI